MCYLYKYILIFSRRTARITMFYVGHSAKALVYELLKQIAGKYIHLIYCNFIKAFKILQFAFPILIGP